MGTKDSNNELGLREENWPFHYEMEWKNHHQKFRVESGNWNCNLLRSSPSYKKLNMKLVWNF